MGWSLGAPFDIKGGIFWKGGVDYGSVAYSCQIGGYPILGGRGRFSEGRRCLKWGYIVVLLIALSMRWLTASM